jgi:GNAT superfamily N-acetyltransferase
MFVDALASLRRRVPALPPDLEDVAEVGRRLQSMAGFAALQDATLVGYLTSWFPIERFRETARVAAYAPEWAHGSIGPDRRAIDHALYRAASAAWSSAGCDTHALTLLAGEDDALETWFWSGFGMGTVDAVRPLTPIGHATRPGLTVRRSTPGDSATLAALDVDHQRHYRNAPVFMVPPEPDDASAWTAFIERPGATVWLAEDDGQPVGFLRFGHEFNASAVVESATAVFISGAYVRPESRGRGAATAMLDAAIRYYAAEGLASCAVDFEAFNPEATAFWLRHFTPVCHSLMRVPESPTA